MLAVVAMSGGAEGFLLAVRPANFWQRGRNMQLSNFELKGKPLSLGAKIIGAIIAVSALVLKATISPGLDIDAAIKVAAFVVIVFAPVDVSMVMSNIFTPLASARTNYAQSYTAPQVSSIETGGGK
jgi:hypothetical protein